MGRFSIARPGISQVGRITSDIISGMAVTQFDTGGHVAKCRVSGFRIREL